MKKKIQTTKILNDQGQVIDSEDVGIPGLFPVGQWDIDEEMLNNDAWREHRREQEIEP